MTDSVWPDLTNPVSMASTMCGNTGTQVSVEISVAELDALACQMSARAFEDEEDAIILKYWTQVPTKSILQYLNTHYHKTHTMCQLKHRHSALLSR